MKKIIIWLCLVLMTSMPLFAASSPQPPIKIKVGDYVEFGRYEESPIVWRVIEIDKYGRPLLWSASILTYKAFDAHGSKHEDGERAVLGSNYWKESTLRQWLNSDEDKITWTTNAPSKENLLAAPFGYEKESGFLSEKNFTAEELKGIVETERNTVVSITDLWEATSGTTLHEWAYDVPSKVGLNAKEAYKTTVKDKVFLLDAMEISKYISSKKWSYQKNPTPSALKQMGIQYTKETKEQLVPYWLGMPSTSHGSGVRLVLSDGCVGYNFAHLNSVGIVPAMRINHKKTTIVSGNGTLKKPYKLEGIGSKK